MLKKVPWLGCTSRPSWSDEEGIIMMFIRGWDWCPFLGLLDITKTNITVGDEISPVGWCDPRLYASMSIPCTKQVSNVCDRRWASVPAQKTEPYPYTFTGQTFYHITWVYIPITGWWFGTFFIFPYIGNFIIPIDFHIFQRGKPTTNQKLLLISLHAIGPSLFVSHLQHQIKRSRVRGQICWGRRPRGLQHCHGRGLVKNHFGGWFST